MNYIIKDSKSSTHIENSIKHEWKVPNFSEKLDGSFLFLKVALLKTTTESKIY